MKELSGTAQDAYELVIKLINGLNLNDLSKEIVIGLIDILVETIIAEKE